MASHSQENNFLIVVEYLSIVEIMFSAVSKKYIYPRFAHLG